MSRRVAVIGMGHVGAAVAHQIICTGAADELILIDAKKDIASAEALDLQDSLANMPVYTKIFVNDYARVGAADIIISAVGNVALTVASTGDNRFAETAFQTTAIKSVSQSIKESGFDGKLIVISNPVDFISHLYQTYTGLPKEHVIGTGTLLDSARMHRTVGKMLHIDPRSVQGYTLGEHGNTQFTAWSTVRVFDCPITEFAQKHHIDLDEINNETRKGGFTVAHVKKYTNWGVAAAAVRLMNTIFEDAHTVLPVSNYRDDYHCYLSYPAVVGANGIETQLHLDLTDDEQEKLQKSADAIIENSRKARA